MSAILRHRLRLAKTTLVSQVEQQQQQQEKHEQEKNCKAMQCFPLTLIRMVNRASQSAPKAIAAISFLLRQTHYEQSLGRGAGSEGFSLSSLIDAATLK